MQALRRKRSAQLHTLSAAGVPSPAPASLLVDTQVAEGVHDRRPRAGPQGSAITGMGAPLGALRGRELEPKPAPGWQATLGLRWDDGTAQRQ